MSEHTGYFLPTEAFVKDFLEEYSINYTLNKIKEDHNRLFWDITIELCKEDKKNGQPKT